MVVQTYYEIYARIRPRMRKKRRNVNPYDPKATRGEVNFDEDL